MGVRLDSNEKQEMDIFQAGVDSDKSGPTRESSPLRILIILEARSITGPAKAVLEVTQEAFRYNEVSPCAEISLLVFLRNETENTLTRIVQASGIALEIVTERGAFDWRIIPQLRAIVNRIKPDIVWTNAVKAHFLARIAGLNRQAKWVAFHHGYTTTALRTRMYNQLDRWSLKRAERVVTVCGQFASQMASQGISADRIRVQHMPIRAKEQVSRNEATRLRCELGIADTTRVVLSVSRLSREQGHDDLLRAMARARGLAPSIPMHLLVVGSGPELEALKETCRDLGLLERVSFLGQQEGVSPYYAIADVFVISSHSEGSPNVLLEAMDAGVPIVATLVGGVPEILTNEQEALLVKSRDVALVERRAALHATDSCGPYGSGTPHSGDLFPKHTVNPSRGHGNWR